MSVKSVFVAAFGIAVACAITGASAQVTSSTRIRANPLTDSKVFRPVVPAMAAAYSDTMVRYRFFGESTGSADAGYPIVGAERPAPTVPWIWYGDDGSYVRRVNDGWFRVTAAEPLSNWFASIDCRILDWPQFTCSDGLTRTMSAPSIDTLDFGGVEYHRQVTVEVDDVPAPDTTYANAPIDIMVGDGQ